MTVASALLSPKGRISRRDFWLKGLLILFPIWIAIAYVDAGIPAEPGRSVGSSPLDVVYFLTLWPALALVLKRLHDLGRSGWFAAVLLIPIANLLVMAEMAVVRGTVGPNRFGDDPLP